MKTSVSRMLNISTVLNILVLVPVISVILSDINQVERVWGPNQASRQILVSIYIAILIGSIALFFLKDSAKLLIAITIFSMQIIYKFLTAILVSNSLTNPVVLSNLAINGVHILTLYTVFKNYPKLLKLK